MVLITAYAVHPYKGSEDGTGWNIILSLAEKTPITAITRQNNQTAIEEYKIKNQDSFPEHLDFVYFDLPYWMRFWKKGERGALLYTYLWHLGVALAFWKQRKTFDIVHHLNFHSDWQPSFLWLWGNKFVWGPIGHHPALPSHLITPFYGKKVLILDKIKTLAKTFFRYCDPFWHITRHRASAILTINSAATDIINEPQKTHCIPAVGSQNPSIKKNDKHDDDFTLLSIGRLVPLKGFDLTIAAFAKFWHDLPDTEARKKVRLKIIGKGNLQPQLEALAQKLAINTQIEWIVWMPQSELPQHYQSAHVFLFPSHEGAGMVVPEALSYSLPVICLKNIGPGELINHKSGIAVHPNQSYDTVVGDLAKAIHQLYNETAFRQKMAQEAYLHWQQNFEWKAKSEKIYHIYQNIS